jgi:LysR family hydrogen peroxide-inducible transcriptional activator
MDSQPTLKQLLYFKTLAETRHYRKAAERVGISQPSLSLQIGKLEEILRLQLIERGRAGAVLTPEGREVLEQAQVILAKVATLQETSERMKSGLAGTIRLGSSPTLGPYLLPNVVHRLHRLYPDLRLVIRDGAPFDLLEDLLGGRHDLILTQLPVQSTDVSFVRLFREPLHLAVALDHPLARKTEATDEDLRGESVLLLSRRFTLYNQIAELAREVEANLRQDYEGTSLDALRQMTAMNMGVTFLPALYAHSEIPDPGGDVALVPFRRGRYTRSIGLVWRKSSGNHTAFDIFADVIRSVARERFKGFVSTET